MENTHNQLMHMNKGTLFYIKCLFFQKDIIKREWFSLLSNMLCKIILDLLVQTINKYSQETKFKRLRFTMKWDGM